MSLKIKVVRGDLCEDINLGSYVKVDGEWLFRPGDADLTLDELESITSSLKALANSYEYK